MKTLEHMREGYWKALGDCRCAGLLVQANRHGAAQHLLQEAEKLADAEGKPRNSSDMFVRIAEAKAKAGDLPGAKRCLEKAVKVSHATKANDYHQEIARAQVRIGLLEDAYRTIKVIPQSEWRTLPLAELARETAKGEAASRKRKEGATK